MSDWNTERARHKAERRAPAPETRPPARRKKPAKGALPFEVWRKAGKYQGEYRATRFATREQAQAYIDRLSRGAYVPGLHASPGTPAEEGLLLKRQAELRSLYEIREVR